MLPSLDYSYIIQHLLNVVKHKINVFLNYFYIFLHGIKIMLDVLRIIAYNVPIIERWYALWEWNRGLRQQRLMVE